MSRSLEVLLRSLRLAGLDIDAEAALDSLWLGREILAKHQASVAAQAAATSTAATAGASSTAALGDSERRASGTAKRRDSLSLKASDFEDTAGSRRESTAARARSLTLERAAALPASRDLIKALRPLRRRVISPVGGVLDVDATVRRAAEEDLWFPTFASARERWLDVLLVADHGISMILWKDTIDELERVLRNSGAFRSVRSWWLESDTAKVSIGARGRGASPPTPERLSRMTRGTGRSVILVLSDCVGARWHDGVVPRLIGSWSQALPVALMQVTPEWFWTRTALGDTVNSRFRSAVPAAVNNRLRWDPSALGAIGDSMDDGQTFLRVPAITLTPDAVTRLSELIAGVGREWAHGVVFDLSWEGEEPVAGAPSIAAADRVAKFRTLASKPAQRLAAGFAASPVRTLGVLRLLRRDLLPESTPFAEAEVLLGGIVRVKRDDANWELGASLPLEFVPGVQSLLLDGAIAGDVLRVLTHAAAIAESGVGATFTSWLEDPSSSASQLDPSESEFAAAAAQALGRLGGAYARIVKSTAEAQHGGQSGVGGLGDGPRRAPPAFVGRPHQLPCPRVLHGRREAIFHVNRWINEDQPRQSLMILGDEGIGKSALAGEMVLQWRNNWPQDEPFVWSFQKNPIVADAFKAFRKHFMVPPTENALASAGEILGATWARSRTFVVFDAVDAIDDSAELRQLLSDASSIAGIAGARVLLTSRDPLEGIRAEQLALEPIDREAIEGLVIDLMSPLARSESSDRDRDVMTGIVVALGGGNPFVIKTLVAQTAALPAEALAEELVVDDLSPRTIEPGELPSLNRLVDGAVRARDLSAEGESAFQAGNLRQAFSVFDDVVRLRSDLPSRPRRAHALFDRGRTAFALYDYELAATDLEVAAGLYRTGSAKRQLIRTLVTLASVQVRTRRLQDLQDSIRNLREALEIARATGDSADVIEVSLLLAPLYIQRDAFEDAVGVLRETIDVATRVGDDRAAGAAWLEVASALRNNNPAAIEAGQQAVNHLLKVDEPAMLVKAYSRLVSLYTSIRDFTSADRALQKMRELRPPPAAVDADIRRRSARTSGEMQAQTAETHDALEGDYDVTLSVEFMVRGLVSGAGFRMLAQKIAKELGIEDARAESMPDGQIRVLATGRRSQLKELRGLLREGLHGAHVVEVVTRIVDQPRLY